MRRLLPVLVLALLLAGCSGDDPPTVTQGAATALAPASPGDLSREALSALLLQPADLPGLTQRREFAGVELTTQTTPQLALCEPAVPAAPHQLANVIAESGEAGAVKVFEVVSVYPDEASATAAYAQDVAHARACPSYAVQGRDYRVEDLQPVQAGAEAVHYRLTTPEVVGGDVRTLARQGRFTVLVSGFGAPPGGQSLLDYQTDVLRKAVARLG